MRSLNSFTNHVGGLTADAVEARTHRFRSRISGITKWNTSTKPTEFLFRNPALLSARRGYPHSARAASMNDCKAPFGFQLQNIAVGNQLGPKRIYNFNRVNSQNKFGFYPKDIYKSAENGAQQQVPHDLNTVGNNPQAVRGEECNQYVRSPRPSEVASRSKGFIHHPSIAGERK